MNTPLLDGIRKQAALYHGSGVLVDRLEPRDAHGDPQIPKAVFGTPSRPFALAYAGRRWGDVDFEQRLKVRNGLDKVIMREMRPGAIQDTYGGAKGYLYHLPKKGFELPFRNGAIWEQINRNAVTPSRVEKINNVLKAIQEDPNIELIPYNPEGPATRRGVQRMVRMAKKMKDGGARYLKWRLKGAPPEIVAMFDEEIKRQGT